MRGLFDIEAIKGDLSVVKEQTNNPNLWDDQSEAQKLLKKQNILEELIKKYNAIQQDHTACLEMLQLLDGDTEIDLLKDLEKDIKLLSKNVKDLKFECLFSGEVDANNCFLEIHAGAGGTESHDWAEMLQRMYLRFAERHDFKTEVIDILQGEEAGIKSATYKMSGHNAFGWLKAESGVHRLVRISPFNAAGKRQTSFASVWVYPEIDDSIDIEINEGDCRIDTYRASGAGGQHVNTTDSAVRITHKPTGIVVQCQNDRSQHKNKAEAFSMLKARLYEFELRKREDAANVENAKKTDNSWGNQIRSYVLHPYRMVKDHRTNFETSATDDVLDGEIDEFIMAMLTEQSRKRGV